MAGVRAGGRGPKRLAGPGGAETDGGSARDASLGTGIGRGHGAWRGGYWIEATQSRCHFSIFNLVSIFRCVLVLVANVQRALDTDGDRRIDFEELVAFWLADEEGIDPEVVRAASEIARRERQRTRQAIKEAQEQRRKARDAGEEGVREGDGSQPRGGASWSLGLQFNTTYG